MILDFCCFSLFGFWFGEIGIGFGFDLVCSFGCYTFTWITMDIFLLNEPRRSGWGKVEKPLTMQNDRHTRGIWGRMESGFFT